MMKHTTYQRREFLKAAGAAAVALAFGSMPSAGRAAGATDGKVKIGVVGSGRVGGTVGGVWAKAGHEVMFSSLDLEADKKLAASLGPNARAGTPREAAAFGDVVLISVPYAALPSVGRDLGDLIKGKIVIDTSNPIVARDGDMAVAAREKGAGISSQEFLPGARIVRAFNILGTGRLKEMANHPGSRFAIPVAGNDQEALKVVSALVRAAGFEPVIVGSLERSKLFEQGGPLYGAQMSADEMREKLKTLP
jgi:predicted dinucleotide-binding enzyme